MKPNTAATMDSDAKQWLKRLNKWKSDRSNWDSRWQEVGYYVFPEAADFNIENYMGTEKRDRKRLFDETAIHAAKLLSHSIHGAVVPPGMPWVDFVLHDSEFWDNKEVQKWIEQCTAQIRFLFNQSNFNTEMQVFFKYLVVFGTAGVLFEEVWNTKENHWEFLFTALSPKEFYCCENAYGFIDTVIRPRKYKAYQIEQKWPDALKKSSKIAKACQENPDAEFEIIHVTAPKDGRYTTSNKNHKFISKWILKDNDNPIELDNGERGFFSDPYMIVRWEKIRGETYGGSPAMDAIPAIRSLNEAMALMLEGVDKAINPPTVVQDGALTSGNVNLSTRGVNTITDVNQIRTLIDSGRYDVGKLMIEELRDQVRKAMYVDQIQPPPMEGTPQTAFAWQVTYEFQHRVLGPLFGRHEYEFLNKKIERAFDIATRRNLLPPPPAILAQSPGRIDPEYIGPLAKAQKRFLVDAGERFIAKIIQLIPIISPTDPSIIFKLDWEQVLESVADADGVPPKWFRAKDQVKKLTEDYMKMQQAQAVSTIAQGDASAVKDLATAQKMAQGG